MFHNEIENDMQGICDECGCACSPKGVDCGIGAYEYWGARGYHRDIQYLSPCCEAKVVEGGTKIVSRKIHTARIAHGNIPAGVKYQRIVTHHWRNGGPGWYTVKRLRAEL